MNRTILIAAAGSLALAAQAQTQSPLPGTAPGAVQQGQAPASGSGAQPNPAQMMQNLPEGCRKSAQSSPMGQMMQNMPMMQAGGMMPMQNMPMMANMPEANRDYMEVMRKMNPLMMMGMTINDPELAFLCSMIPHHQGAIDMAQAVLKHTKDADVKRAAEKSIKEQEKEIAELTDLVKEHAK
jgi:uncharacterized protein (DUF305 family)